MSPRARLARAFTALSDWLYTPRDTRVVAGFRIAYATMLLVNALAWLPDLDLWFGEQGVLPYADSRRVIDQDTLGLFALLPKTRLALWCAYLTFVTHVVLLGLGYFTRLQAVCAFVWLVSFQHRNILLFDGEDNVFRVLGFCLVFVPAGARWSIDAWIRRRFHGEPPRAAAPAWGMRLAQVQMTAIYASTVCLKLTSEDWRSGEALYYVARLDDLYGRFPMPAWLFETPVAYHTATWLVLTCELCLPVALWVPRLRAPALGLAAALHLGLDYAMNLFLFQWIMLCGLLSFLEPESRRQAGSPAAFTLDRAAPGLPPDPTDPVALRSHEEARGTGPGS
jgi:uncharacterized membrane protein YphA (DoxX/SURF4 family)